MTIASADRTRLQRLFDDPTITVPVVMVVLHRLITLVLAFYAANVAPLVNPYEQAPLFVASLQGVQTHSLLHPIIEPWHRWDTGFFLKIAIAGYGADDGTIGFQPLYPMLIRAASLFTGDTLLAALIVSTVCELIFFIMLARLIIYDFNRRHLAFNTLFAYLIIPTGFFLVSGHTESLFLVCSVGAFFAARKKRWWLAAVFVILATLTRIQGIVLIIPIAWMVFDGLRIFQTLRSLKLTELLPRVAPLIAGPITVAGFVIYLSVAGMGNYYEAYSKLWKVDARFPGVVLVDLIAEITAGKATFSEYGSLITVIFIVVCGIAGLRLLPTAYSLYLWATLGILLVSYHRDNLNLMNSFMRYGLHFFPAFIIVGMFFTRFPRLRIVLAVVGILIQVLLLFVFARWGWVA